MSPAGGTSGWQPHPKRQQPEGNGHCVGGPLGECESGQTALRSGIRDVRLRRVAPPSWDDRKVQREGWERCSGEAGTEAIGTWWRSSQGKCVWRRKACFGIQRAPAWGCVDTPPGETPRRSSSEPRLCEGTHG